MLIRLASFLTLYPYGRHWSDHWYLLLLILPILFYGYMMCEKTRDDIQSGKKPGVKPRNNNDFFFWWRD